MENILENKDLINSYLSLSILQQFNLNIDLKDEYVFAENLVSKKPIIVTTFSGQILSNIPVKMFLTFLITDINNGNCKADFMRNRLKTIQDDNPQQMREIS